MDLNRRVKNVYDAYIRMEQCKEKREKNMTEKRKNAMLFLIRNMLMR